MNARNSNLLDWNKDRDEVLRRIEGKNATFKILLKTRDDKFLLEKWINHHLQIVGIENLIIFDNMSSDEEVLTIYDKYKNELFVIRFDDFHNNVHDYGKYEPLYSSLFRSCRYYSFLDTDEMLILISDARYYKDYSIVEFLSSKSNECFFPCSWIYDAPGSDTVFYIGSDQQKLIDGLTWGKPIIKPYGFLKGMHAHNIQCPKQLFKGRMYTNFFLLHLAQFNSEQRIRSNLNKLISRGVVQSEASVESVVNLNVNDNMSYNVKLYINEIVKLSQNGFNICDYDELPAGCIRLSPDGNILFKSKIEDGLLSDFILRGNEIAKKVLHY